MAHSNHREVILHLPMQPREYPRINPGKGALLLTMSDDTLRRNVRTAIDASPFISGMNNHMGSLFTENAGPMRVVLEELHQRSLYYLDSFTSPKSAGADQARQTRVPFARRDVFLDHTQTEQFVRSQLNELLRKAIVHGTAIAIGHPHDVTYRVLKKEASRFETEKISVVPLGQLTVSQPSASE